MRYAPCRCAVPGNCRSWRPAKSTSALALAVILAVGGCGSPTSVGGSSATSSSSATASAESSWSSSAASTSAPPTDLTLLPPSVVTVPKGYGVVPLKVTPQKIVEAMGPEAEQFSSALDAALTHAASVAGTVQLFRLKRPIDDEFTGRAYVTSVFNQFTNGADTTEARWAGQYVLIARNIRGSGLDAAAWVRHADLVFLTAYPAKGDLKAVGTTIVQHEK